VVPALIDSGVELVAVDNPHTTRLTLHTLAAVAEHDREMIAARTKTALQAGALAQWSGSLDASTSSELKTAGVSTRLSAELTARGIAMMTRATRRRPCRPCSIGATKDHPSMPAGSGLRGSFSKRKGSRYSSGRFPHWLKSKNLNAPAARREGEEDWGDRKGVNFGNH
jgi:hypothetical protein